MRKDKYIEKPINDPLLMRRSANIPKIEKAPGTQATSEGGSNTGESSGNKGSPNSGSNDNSGQSE